MTLEQVDPIRNIAKRAQQIAEDNGLKLRHFALVPALDDGPEKAQLIFEYDPKEDKPEIVLEQADSELSDAMDKVAREELEKRAQKAREEIEENLKRRLQNPGGGFIDGA